MCSFSYYLFSLFISFSFKFTILFFNILNCSFFSGLISLNILFSLKSLIILLSLKLTSILSKSWISFFFSFCFFISSSIFWISSGEKLVKSVRISFPEGVVSTRISLTFPFLSVSIKIYLFKPLLFICFLFIVKSSRFIISKSISYPSFPLSLISILFPIYSIF